MRVSAVNTFCSVKNFKAASYVQPEPKVNPNLGERKQEIKQLALYSCAAAALVLGSAFLISHRKELNPKKIYKNFVEKYEKTHSHDAFVRKVIGDNRGAEAREQYEALMASKKMHSLDKRVLAGEFNGKTGEEYLHITRNKVGMERLVRRSNLAGVI